MRRKRETMTVLNESRQLMDAAKARIRIRDGGSGDTLGILLLLCEAFDERVPSSGYTARALGDMKMATRMSQLVGDRAPVRTVVADLDGDIIAAVVGSRRGNRSFFTEGIATTGEWWDEGIGSRLYERFFEVMRRVGARRVYADVETWNAGAIRFHERNGFTRAPGFEDRAVVRKIYRWVQQYRGHLGPWTPLRAPRPLQPADVPALARLFAARYDPVRVDVGGMDAETLRELGGGLPKLFNRFGKGMAEMLAAKDDAGRVIGGAVATYDAGSYRLNGIVAADEDEDVAMALVHTLIYRLQRRGVRRIQAEVTADDAWLGRVLDRAGFESLYRRERLYRYGEVHRPLDYEAFRYCRDV